MSFFFEWQNLKSFDGGSLTGIILIDLQEEFDTIDRDMLSKKLSITDFSDHTVKWFNFNYQIVNLR